MRPSLDRMGAAGGEHAVDVGFRDRPPTVTLAEKVSLVSRPQETLTMRPDRDLGHALGGVDRLPDRLLGRVEIDDDARLDAARARGGEAEHLDGMRAAPQRSPSRGVSRAIRQQILVEPTSRTVTTVGRRERAA